MKTFVRSFLLAATLLLIPAISFAQGSLTPPGGPAPTMKTLAQIEPRLPIYTIPTNITTSGSYYLTTNLIGSANSNGIVIYTNDVTIDLAGFTLIGVPSSLSGIIYNGGHADAVIRNGAVKNWGSLGIDLGGGSNNIIDHVNISGCGGIGLLTGRGDLVSYCSVSGNASTGVSAGWFNQIDHCNSFRNGGHGFLLGLDDQITASGASENTLCGIYLGSSGDMVSGCNCNGNSLSGIYVWFGPALIINNLVSYNNGGNNTNNAGIYDDDQDCRIDGNHMAYNGYAGLVIGPDENGNVIVRNSVAGYSLSYILTPGNDVGPIGTATNSTSPWANISN